MKTTDGLLMIEPTGPAATVPVVDVLTRRMTEAWRHRRDAVESYRGWHRCVCGVASDNKDHWVGGRAGDDRLTNSLCIHYLAYHRADISPEECEKVLALPGGEAEPTFDELKTPRAPTPPRQTYKGGHD